LNHKPPENAPEAEEPQKKQKTFTIGALGAGSDYVAFLDYAGIASMNEGFGGMDRSGIYHSVYDSIYWYNHFSDGSHVYGQALSQYTTTALMRLAGAEVLPLEFSHFVQTVTGYVDEIEREAASKGQPMKFTDLRKQLQAIASDGEKYEAALKNTLAKTSLDETRVAELNKTLMQTERVLLRPEGLPNRTWYKHQIYAPGFYTGYGVKTLPGMREAVDANQWDLADQEAKKVAECLDNFHVLVVKATEECQGL
jgi:N-acetylated-alpha-linked acidic dipeptidase